MRFWHGPLSRACVIATATVVDYVALVTQAGMTYDGISIAARWRSLLPVAG
jgi:hypothetical protein